MKTQLLISVLFVLTLAACNHKPKTDQTIDTKETHSTPTVKSDYSIPTDLTPVNRYKNGYTFEEAMKFRGSYGPASIVTADDVGSYASSRLSEFNNSAIVHRDGAVSELKLNIMPEISQTVATTILGTMSLEEMIKDDRSRMKAIAVIHNGELVFEKYIGIRDWDNHFWASATKIVVGTLIHIADEDGLVDLKKDVTGYLPELNGTNWEGIMVEDVLHMRSGLDVGEGGLNISPDHPISLYYAIVGGDSRLEGLSLLDAVKAGEELVVPGSRYEYSSINTHVLSLILQKVYDKPVEDIITERIWSKSGMEGDGVLALSATGEPVAPGAFAARLRDLARFGMLFTPSWNTVSSEQIISDTYFDKVNKAALPEIYGEDYMSKRLINDFGESNFGASYQWDAVFADGDLYKSGRTGQCLYVSPATNTVVVWYSSSYNAGVWVHAYAREIVKQLFR